LNRSLHLEYRTSTTFIRAFDGVEGSGEDERLEVGRDGCICRDGCVCRDGGRVKGGDAKGFGVDGGKSVHSSMADVS
jgi:hypothetical protein